MMVTVMMKLTLQNATLMIGTVVEIVSQSLLQWEIMFKKLKVTMPKFMEFHSQFGRYYYTQYAGYDYEPPDF